jgi:integrase/recombinase XerD
MPEFNPINELIKKQYEEALIHGRCRDPKTVKAVWDSITIFERFTGKADFKTFNSEQAKGFKKWLENQTNKGGELLSLSTVRGTLNNIREFFLWLTIHPKYVRKIDGRAVEYLRLSNNDNRAARASRDKIPPTIEELQKTLSAMPFETDIEKRDKAIFAFMILTCVRDDALVSLRIKDVDVSQKTVWQDPKHVRTKFRKAILTRFVSAPIPEAEAIYMDWYVFAQDVLKAPPDAPLFPQTLVIVNRETLTFEAKGLSRDPWASAAPVREIFKRAFASVGLPYFNPHLFRNTIVQWAEKNCTPYEFKAISQNLGHEHAMTTYNSYGKLSERAQIEAIANLSNINADINNVPMDIILAELARRTSGS